MKRRLERQPRARRTPAAAAALRLADDDMDLVREQQGPDLAASLHEERRRSFHIIHFSFYANRTL